MRPSEIMIRVEGLAKAYRLGEITSGTLAHDISRWWARRRGRPDPLHPVMQDHGKAPQSVDRDIVWALRDIRFDVRRGEVLGIIGRNGAGKSTLLKILSRITAPTEGCVKLGGRIGALLEVGTGFHPDLTGRENIYLNGAILGMTKEEIRQKYSEIVRFSGCERYIDTPVKRYSSGMAVRLGFAVAAHLEPDILIVDEVLAVGDAEFQQKCIGKMQDVAGHGRTVLFVSHNMASIQALTERCLVIEEGSIASDAPTEEAVARYLAAHADRALVGVPVDVEHLRFEKRVRNDPALAFARLGLAAGAAAEIPSGGSLVLEIALQSQGRAEGLTFGYSVRHETTAVVYNGYSPGFAVDGPGLHTRRLHLQQLELAPGVYDLHLSLNRGGLMQTKHAHDMLFGVARFRVTSVRAEGGVLPQWRPGWGHVIHLQSRVESLA